MTVEDERRVEEAKIRELLDDWVHALRSRDADASRTRATDGAGTAQSRSGRATLTVR